MSKLNKLVMMSGSCLLIACVCTTMADDLAAMKKDGFTEAFSKPQKGTLSTKWDADGAKLDKVILIAQATTATPKTRVMVRPNSSGADVVATKEFSTWSDLTAVFRPSRWKNPAAEGGSLSWLNHEAWSAAPGRTGKVLAGEVLVVVAAYWTADGLEHYYTRHRDNDDGHHSSNDGGTGGDNDGGELPF